MKITKLTALAAVPIAALGLGLSACAGQQPAAAPPTIVHVTSPPKVIHVASPTKTVYVTPPPTTPTASAPPAAPVAPPAAPVAPPAAPAAPPPQVVNAEAVVTQFYQDITDQNYPAAWALGGDNLNGGVGYSQWVAGYATTASISLGTFSSFSSDQVAASLSAVQTDGSMTTYQGTYTVQNGVIVSANIVQTS